MMLRTKIWVSTFLLAASFSSFAFAEDRCYPLDPASNNGLPLGASTLCIRESQVQAERYRITLEGAGQVIATFHNFQRTFSGSEPGCFDCTREVFQFVTASGSSDTVVSQGLKVEIDAISDLHGYENGTIELAGMRFQFTRLW